MAQASKPTSAATLDAMGFLDSQKRPQAMAQLQEMLSIGSDVQLLFDDGAVPGHTNILSMWSKVFGTTLQAGTRSSSSSSSSSTRSAEQEKQVACEQLCHQHPYGRHQQG
jgi:hypothetical protein